MHTLILLLGNCTTSGAEELKQFHKMKRHNMAKHGTVKDGGGGGGGGLLQNGWEKVYAYRGEGEGGEWGLSKEKQ